MALTLLEFKKQKNVTVQEANVIDYYAEASTVLTVIPIRNIAGNSIEYDIVDKLPGVQFRGINEGYLESTGIYNKAIEVLRTSGGDVDIDRKFFDMAGVAPSIDSDVAQRQIRLKVEAFALYMHKKLLRGDSDIDQREFDGLQKRIVGRQLLHAIYDAANPDATTGAPPAGAAAGGNPLSLFQLNRAIKSVKMPTHLIMNGQMALRLTQGVVSGAGGTIGMTMDTVGRQMTTYNGLPIIEIDYDENGDDVLGFNEPAYATGGTNSTTSVYVVSFRTNHVEMIQGLTNGRYGISAFQVGGTGYAAQLEAKPTLRFRVEWDTGLMIQHGRAAARIRSISDAAVVA